MTERWQQWQQRFASLSLRERALILISGFVVLSFPAYYFWLEPMSLQQAKAKTAFIRLSAELKENQIQIDYSQRKLAEDPNAELQRQVAQLRAQSGQIDRQLAIQQAGLIPVGKMAEVLEQLLQHSEGLQLLSLDSIAPEPVLTREEESDNSLNFYRHGIRLKLTGGYFPLLKYLQKVEALPQRFLWQLIEYQVDAYPRANITIDIYTLSSHKDFISA
ncbi:hypothetical protein ACRRS0_11165 [Agarivorans sp. QJM3NY_29]|uniref:hypothetical protein n=1 Tax=unclassified Agarivorans TaxID=2636026 RepID=UPI003D7CB323